MIWLSVLISFAWLFLLIDAHRILGIMSLPSYSHQIVYQPLWRELSLRGHQVTVLTSNPMKDSSLTNLTEIDTSFMYEAMKDVNYNNLLSMNRFRIYHRAVKLGIKMSDLQLQHPQVQAIIQDTTQHFDVVLVELHYQTMFAFAERFKCPVIAVSSLEANSRIYNAIGNPHHPLINTEIFSPTDDYSTFYERFLSAAYSFYIQHLSNYLYAEEQNKIITKHFGPSYPSVADLEKRTSMIFINTDLIFHNIHPLLPSVIPIGGGIHVVKTSTTLPKHLQAQCDNAKNGFIYFSLGSNLRSHHLPEHTIRLLLDMFAEIPYTVFWKFEALLLEKPPNVITDKWFPQQDLLEHPNMKLFITQGGLQSLHEAILRRVPILGIPLMTDQIKNIDKILQKGMGLSIDFKTISKDSLKSTIMETITNSKYRRNVEKYADMLKDEPMSGLQKAVWWTEYVIRHKGTKHFRSYGAEIPSYQYFLLDVIGFCLTVIGVLVTLLVLIAKLFVKICKNIFFRKPKRE